MYTALAAFYDRFMEENMYADWLNFLIGVLGEPKQGVDFGCGTGKFTIGLHKRGFDVYGVDVSVKMLQAALTESKKASQNISFILGDMQNFKFMKKPQFVTAICDTVNYIKKPYKTFCHLYQNLAEGGLFIFDISSEYKLKNILGFNTYSETKDDITYIWQNSLFKDRVEMELTFFQPKDALYFKSSETQTQYIHKTEDVLSDLRAAGFKAEAYGNFAKRGVLSKDERIYFIARK